MVSTRAGSRAAIAIFVLCRIAFTICNTQKANGGSHEKIDSVDPGLEQGQNPYPWRQYMLGVDPSKLINTFDRLRNISVSVRIQNPENLIVVLQRSDAEKLKDWDGILSIGKVPDELRVSADLRKQQSQRRGLEDHACTPSEFYVLTASNRTNREFVMQQLVSKCKSGEGSQKGDCTFEYNGNSPKGLVTTTTCRQDEVLAGLLDDPSVLWIEDRKQPMLLNKYATRIVQSKNGSSPSIWNQGLMGDGEVIALSDTGVDSRSCFFQDPAVPLPLCQGEGFVNATGCINPQHRKIVTYRYFSTSDAGDAYGGHGTHVAGTIAGQRAGPNASTLDAFQGVAPHAKLAVDDLSPDGWSLFLPVDLNVGLFPHSYAAGARLHSNSWGHQYNGYDTTAMEFDKFIYNHDDFLGLAAAGNSGPGASTVISPGTGKNLLSVGASQNALPALQEYGVISAYLASYPSPGADPWRFALQPAEFGAAVLLGTRVYSGLLAVPTPADACSSPPGGAGQLQGKVALVAVGACEVSLQALVAQQAGAVAVVVYSNQDNGLPYLGAGSYGSLVTIPVVSVPLWAGQSLLSQLAAAGNLTVALPVTNLAADSQMTLTDFSSRGPTSDHRFKPDVVCPGGNIRSALSSGGAGGCGLTGMSGTSMATPNCAGSAALVRQYFREGFHAAGVRNLSAGVAPSAALVKAVLLHSGRALWVPVEGGGAGLYRPDTLPHYTQGFGLVDLSSVLRFAAAAGGGGGGGGFSLRVWDRLNMSHGQVRSTCVAPGEATASLRVTLVWTDPPGSPGAARALVNDLDLVIVDARGRFYYGNALVHSDETHGPHPAADDVNNAEQITIAVADSGPYSVRVSGVDVPLGPQRYALVLTSSAANLSTSALCPPQPLCPGNCSGRGTCVAGRCQCPAGWSGVDCALASRRLSCGQAARLSLAPMSWAYYLVDSPVNWIADVTADAGSADLHLAYARVPARGDYAGTVSAGAASQVSSSPGYVLGVFSRCCTQANLTVALTCDDDLPCAAGYTLRNGSCAPCETAPCPAGYYRGACTSTGEGPCLPMRCPGSGSILTAPNGTITDGAGDYTNYASCSWIIAPDNAASVTLSFSSFSTESGYDFVRVYACQTAPAQCQWSPGALLASYAGPYLPKELWAPFSAILVTFTSDGSVTQSGFEAVYSGSDARPVAACPGSGSILTAPNGTITDGPGDYTNYANCSWVIAPENATSWRLSFRNFSTESGYDFVRVYACSSPQCNPSSNSLWAQWSGSFLPGDLWFSSQAILVTFTSDGSITFPGFVADYVAAIRPPPRTCPGSGATLTAPSGSISDGPGDYTDAMSCSWVIAPTGASSVTLIFRSFSLETNWDFVRVYTCLTLECNTTTGVLVAGYTGYGAPADLVVWSPVILVTFTTDWSVTSSGFDADYYADLALPPGGISTTPAPGPGTTPAPGPGTTPSPSPPGSSPAPWPSPPPSTPAPTTCPGSSSILTAPNGTFTDGPGDYPNYASCSWIIAPAGGADAIHISFRTFVTEDNFDFVRVYACASPRCDPWSAALVAAYSGSGAPGDLVVPAAAVLVTFTSDGSVTRAGFEAVYWAEAPPASDAASCALPRPAELSVGETCCSRVLKALSPPRAIFRVPPGSVPSKVLVWLQDPASNGTLLLPAAAAGDMTLEVRVGDVRRTECELSPHPAAYMAAAAPSPWRRFAGRFCTPDAAEVAAAGRNGRVKASVEAGGGMAAAAAASGSRVVVEVCSAPPRAGRGGRGAPIDVWVHAE